MAPSLLVDEHRRDLAFLIGLATSNLLDLWVFGDDYAATQAGLTDILPTLVDEYGSAATALGADWYEEYRAESGVTDRFTALVAPLPDRGRTDALAGWATSFKDRYDPIAAQQKVTGGLQRIVANADRQTVMGSATADPKAVGWKRVGGGDCDFCRMLISRGAVYSEATAHFQSHDNCKCSAVPEWR
jgi:hypothetical protein